MLNVNYFDHKKIVNLSNISFLGNMKKLFMALVNG